MWQEDDLIHESCEEIWEEMMEILWKEELSGEEDGAVTTTDAVVPPAAAGPSDPSKSPNANNPTPPSPCLPSSSSVQNLANKVIHQAAREIAPPLPQISTTSFAEEKRSLMLLMDLCKQRIGLLDELDAESTGGGGGGDDSEGGGGDDEGAVDLDEELASRIFREEQLQVQAKKKDKGKGKEQPKKKKDKGKGKEREYP